MKFRLVNVSTIYYICNYNLIFIMKKLFFYVLLLMTTIANAQVVVVGTGGTRPEIPGIIEKGRVATSTSTGKSVWSRLKRTNTLAYVNGVFTWVETDGVDSLAKTANLDSRYLQTISATSTYFPRTSGVLYGLTSIRKKTAYNSSDTLFVLGGLGSGFGEVGQGDRLEFKQVSFTGVPRWDISNFVAGTYQTNLTFLGQNIGVKRTNPSYNFDINGTFRAGGNSVFDGNVGIGETNPSDKLSIRSTVSADAYTRFQGTGSIAGGFQIGLGGVNQVALLNRENTDMEFYTNNSLKAIIKAGGNVGIGTSIPSERLQIDVQNVANTKLVKFSTNNNANNYGDISVQSGELRYSSPFGIGIAPNNSVRAFFATNGNIGFGTASPLTPIHVSLASSTAQPIARFETVGTNSRPYLDFKADNVDLGYLGWGGTGSDAMYVTNYRNSSINLQTNSILRMTVSGSGNVGIGTANPATALFLQSNVATNNTATKVIGLSSDRSDYYSSINSVRGVASTYLGLSFSTSNNAAPSEVLRVEPNGNMGVGTASPNQKIEVANAGEVAIRLNNTSANTWDAKNTATEGAFQLVRGGSNVYFHIGNTGNVGIGNIAPAKMLDVTGEASFSNSSTTGGIHIGPTGFQASLRYNTNGNLDITPRNGYAVSITSNLGIGTSSPNAPLQFASTTSNRKIVLYEDTNNDQQFYGFGINGSTLRYQVNNTASNHVFFAGTSTTTSQQLLSINGDQTVTHTPLTTAQINALVKAKGKVAYNSDTDKMVYCTGTSGVWKYFDGSNM